MTRSLINPRITPVEDLADRILIVYAVDGTSDDDISEAKTAVESFSMEDQKVTAEAFAFPVPPSSRPGAALGAELGVQLDMCVGGIVFVDHLRPNVVYELGYLHGRGRPVLLVTRNESEQVWTHMSDLAGTAIADLRRQPLSEAVHKYLTRLYTEDLRAVEPVSTIPLASAERNLTTHVLERDLHIGSMEGPFGPTLALRRYNPPTVIPVRRSVAPTARAQVIMRAQGGPEHISVYFQVWYTNRKRDPATIQIGTTTHRRDAWITRRERQVPAQMLTAEWTALMVQFSDLFRRGSVLGTSMPYYLEQISFRVGHGIQTQDQLKTVELAFVGVYGFDD